MIVCNHPHPMLTLNEVDGPDIGKTYVLVHCNQCRLDFGPRIEMGPIPVVNR